MDRFDLAYPGIGRVLFTPIGLGPGQTYVTLDGDQVRVRFGRLFSLTFPRDDLLSVAPFPGRRRFAWGVHGWDGAWSVQTTSGSLVRLRLRPPGRGWLGLVPVRVDELLVSVADVEAVLAALDPATSDA